MKLVDSLVRQLNAKIEIGREGGASFRIRFQLPSN
jgi:two-component sensor histidine kinase